MREIPLNTFAASKTRNQKTLIQFLDTDLDLAFTFLEMAQSKARDPDRCKSLLEKAQIALNSIRRFEGRVEDQGASYRIHKRADELEAAINSLSGS